MAAIGSSDTAIIKALFDRGSNINESDGIFKGTPLTGAAGYSKHPEIIDQLIKLGADINQKVHNEETSLMVTARYKENPGTATMLVKNGAKLNDKNRQGETAIDLAKQIKNTTVVNELKSLKD